MNSSQNKLELQTTAVSLQPFTKPAALAQESEDDTMSDEFGTDDPTLLPVPIALAQEPAPVDLDTLVTHGHAKARLTIQKSVSTDYGLKKSFAMKKRRSTSEVKNCFSSQMVKQDENLQAVQSSIQQSPYATEGAKGTEEVVAGSAQDIMATENKNLKQQIAQLQNVIVSMCVLNQRQQSVRTTSSKSKKGSHSRSGKATTNKSRSLSDHNKDSNYMRQQLVGNQSAGPLHQRRNTTGAQSSSKKVEIISQSIQKQIEPHPESLMIEPIERPALLSTIPPDWLAVDQQPPKFKHTGSPETSDQDAESSGAGSQGNLSLGVGNKRKPQHNRRFSHQGHFGASRASADHFLNENYLKNAGTCPLLEYESQEVSMPQYCYTNKAAALQQLLFTVNNTVENNEEEGEVDLNEADIEVMPDKIPTRQENTTSSSVSLTNNTRRKPSGHRGRSNHVPNFMKKTVSSTAKQVQKSTMSSASSTSTNSVRQQKNDANMSNYATRYTSSRRNSHSSSTKPYKSTTGSKTRDKMQESSLARSEVQFCPQVLSDDSNAEVSICATSEAINSHFKNFAKSKKSHKKQLGDRSFSCTVDNGSLFTKGNYDFAAPAIISQQTSNSKISSKIRYQQTSSKKYRNQKEAVQQLAKRQEFEDLTKKQNSKLSQQKHSFKATIPSQVLNQTVMHVASSNLKRQPKRQNSQNSKLKEKEDRRLFQKTIEKIQSDQQIRNMKQELKFKKQLGSVSVANSTMSKEELAKVLHDATSASLNSSQKLHYNASKKHQSNRVLTTDPVLTSPAMVSQKILLSDHLESSTLDHVEGPMPNTGKYIFDSAEKAQVLADQDNVLEDTAVFSESQDAVEQMLLDQMANQSPLKSGPSTVKGASVYESPNKANGSPQLTSSMKKIIVPPLNFEKVFEQQRLIMEQEERRKREDEKKKLLLLQQKQKERAFQNSASSKKHIKSQNLSHSKKKPKNQKLINSSASAKFEESPQSKCSYNIEEESQNIVHVYGGNYQAQPSINDFDTIVKVDKKTEEKLMRSSIEVSGKKKAQQGKRSRSKQNTADSTGIVVVSETPKPILAPPEAVQAPSKPENQQQHIRLSNVNQKPMRFTMSKSQTTVQTPSKQQKSSHTTDAAAKQPKKSSVTRLPQQQHSFTGQKPIHSQQFISRNNCNGSVGGLKHHTATAAAAMNKSMLLQSAQPIIGQNSSHTVNITPKSRNYGKHVPSQHIQPQSRPMMMSVTSPTQHSSQKDTATLKHNQHQQPPQQATTAQRKRSLTIKNSTQQSTKKVAPRTASKDDRVVTNNSSGKKRKGMIKATTGSAVADQSMNSKQSPSKNSNSSSNIFVSKNSMTKVKASQPDDLDRATQNLLDQVSEPLTGKSQKRSQSRVFIEELMQPILKQQTTTSKTRPGSIVPLLASGSDVIFNDQPRSCPFSPPSSNLATGSSTMLQYSRTSVTVKDGHSRFTQARSSNRVVTNSSKSVGGALKKRHNSIVQVSAAQKQVTPAPITAFDNGDICDIDKQLSLNVKVPVQAPSILRKTKTAAMAASDANNSPGLGLVQNNSQSSGGFLPQKKADASAQMISKGASSTASASLRSRQASGSRATSKADTYSSLFKKRSGILQRQATAINQVEQKGRAWKI